MSDQGEQNNTLTHSAMDSYAGPDIAPFDPEDSGEQFDDSEFRPATEVFSGGDLDILQQHGTQSSSVSHLARYESKVMCAGICLTFFMFRQSLYVKFDPLIGGRPSVMGRPSIAPNFKPPAPAAQESLIDMNSPSPCKKGAARREEDSAEESQIIEGGDGSVNEEELRIREIEFQENLMQREQKLVELQKELEQKTREVAELKKSLSTKLDSEGQMKEVVAEYEKTISELISDKEKEKAQLENDVARMISEKNQAIEDLRNVEAAFADVHRKYERTKQV